MHWSNLKLPLFKPRSSRFLCTELHQSHMALFCTPLLVLLSDGGSMIRHILQSHAKKITFSLSLIWPCHIAEGWKNKQIYLTKQPFLIVRQATHSVEKAKVSNDANLVSVSVCVSVSVSLCVSVFVCVCLCLCLC